MLSLSDFAKQVISPGGRGLDSRQLSLPSAPGEEQLITLKDNVNIKWMGLISHEYIYDGEVLQSPEHRGSGMRTTGESNLMWRRRPTDLRAQRTHMANEDSRKLKGGKGAFASFFFPPSCWLWLCSLC